MAGLSWLTARPVAHRGYHDREAGRIENTITAAEAAIGRNFAIECDLQLTGDGKPVVFHDDTLDRLTEETGPVAAKTLAELKAVPLKGTTDRIPTLAELLEAVAGKVPLFVELKSHFDGERGLERAAAPLLLGYRGPLTVMSFDPASMLTMKSLAPSLPRGMIADGFADAEWAANAPLRRFGLRHLLAAPLVRPSFVTYRVHDLPANAPLLLRHLGLPLFTWTVKTEADRAKARRYCDQIVFEGFDPDATSTAPARSA